MTVRRKTVLLAAAVFGRLLCAGAMAEMPAAPPALEQLDLPTLQKQAGRGDAPAQFELGKRYQHGRGVRKDPRRALGLYRQAAEQEIGRASCRERV